jgi:hypothetical protein
MLTITCGSPNLLHIIAMFIQYRSSYSSLLRNTSFGNGRRFDVACANIVTVLVDVTAWVDKSRYLGNFLVAFHALFI